MTSGGKPFHWLATPMVKKFCLDPFSALYLYNFKINYPFITGDLSKLLHLRTKIEFPHVPKFIKVGQLPQYSFFICLEAFQM